MKNFWNDLEKLNPKSSIEKDVLRVIKTNPFSILEMTIEEFALRCYTTKSTIVKTLQKIGLSGYKELKSVIYNDGLVTKKEMDSISAEGQSTLNNIRASNILLEENGIDKISNYINLDSKVCIVASETTINVAKDFRKDLNTFGIRTTAIEASDTNFWIEEYSCIIFLSCSGVNKEIYDRCKYVLDKCEGKKPKMISMTSTNTSNIKGMVDVYLPGSKYISISEKETQIAAQSILVLWFAIVRIIEEIYTANSQLIEEKFKQLREAR